MAKKSEIIKVNEATSIVSHTFEGNKCRVNLESSSVMDLQSPAVKKAVYEYRNTIGASHMALNKFEGATMTKTEDGPKCSGSWLLTAKL
jgi:hypothetical protein